MNLTEIAPVIDTTGIHIKTYPEILAWFKQQYRSIYGDDCYLEDDSQDGQFLGILAKAYMDVGSAMVDVFNALSVDFSNDESLNRLVRLNGITRKLESYSTATVTLEGVAGTIIQNGQVKDTVGQLWSLPPKVVIDDTGQAAVTVTASVAGSIQAASGAINTIATPVRGWQKVSNINPANVGLPVETSAQLRARREKSTELASQTLLRALEGAIEALPNVSSCRGFENATSQPDMRGLPAHSIALVIAGGDAGQIANLIHLNKTPGCNLFGNVTYTLFDEYNQPVQIKWFNQAAISIGVIVQITPLAGFTNDIADDIGKAVAGYVDSLEAGQTIELARLYAPVTNTSTLFRLNLIQLSRNGQTVTGNIELAFYEKAVIGPDQVQVQVS